VIIWESKGGEGGMEKDDEKQWMGWEEKGMVGERKGGGGVKWRWGREGGVRHSRGTSEGWRGGEAIRGGGGGERRGGRM